MEDKPDKVELATRATASMAISLAGFALGPVGAVLAPGAKEVVSPHLKRVADFMRGRHESGLNRTIRTMQEAERRVAINAEALFEAVMSQPPLRDLFARALSAVYESELEAKVDALVRSMATGAQDESAIDEKQLIVTAIRGIEAAHLAFLSTTRAASIQVSALAVGAEVGLSAPAAGAVVRTLEGLGCVELHLIPTSEGYYSRKAPMDEQAAVVTPFGLLVLERLQGVWR